MTHDGKEGMKQHDFKQFALSLPNGYQERFARLGIFDKLSNHKGILEYADFALALDLFAEMEVDSIDVEMEIVKDDTPKPQILLSASQSVEERDSSSTEESELSDDVDGLFAKLNGERPERVEILQ